MRPPAAPLYALLSCARISGADLVNVVAMSLGAHVAHSGQGQYSYCPAIPSAKSTLLVTDPPQIEQGSTQIEHSLGAGQACAYWRKHLSQ